jgi:hypothetical protein
MDTVDPSIKPPPRLSMAVSTPSSTNHLSVDLASMSGATTPQSQTSNSSTTPMTATEKKQFRRNRSAEEIMTTERSYVQSLTALVDVFIKPLAGDEKVYLVVYPVREAPSVCTRWI